MNSVLQHRRSPPRSAAITTLAAGFMLFSLLTLALLMVSRLVHEPWLLSMAGQSGSGGLTAGVAFLAERSRFVASVLGAGAALTFVLSVSLLLRRPWARRAFIALMALGFVGVLGGVALTPLTFALVPDAAIAEQVQSDQPLIGLVGVLALLIVFGTVFAALFAWAGWKLSTPAACAEFERISASAGG